MKGKRKNDINVVGRWKGKGGRKIEEVVGRWNGKGERKVGEVSILKTIIRKLERKKKKTLKLEMLQCFVLFCLFLLQNPKAELKRLWIGLDNGTK